MTDPDVQNDTKIDIAEMANIVGQTGATVTNFVNFFHKHEVHEKTVMDVGVLRFPDIDHPYFKVIYMYKEISIISIPYLLEPFPLYGAL